MIVFGVIVGAIAIAIAASAAAIAAPLLLLLPYLGAILGPCWLSWATGGPCWGCLGTILEPSWGELGAILKSSRVYLGPCHLGSILHRRRQRGYDRNLYFGTRLGPSWWHLGPS